MKTKLSSGIKLPRAAVAATKNRGVRMAGNSSDTCRSARLHVGLLVGLKAAMKISQPPFGCLFHL
jgi:hypothetical protein